MKNFRFCNLVLQLMMAMVFTASCKSQGGVKQIDENKEGARSFVPFINQNNLQIAEYIRHIYQDGNDHFWFGTNGFGAALYDGKRVTYFSEEEGFGGRQITGITQDLDGNIWFATDKGIVKYDGSINEDGGKIFTNFMGRQYFGGQRFWSVFADSKGHIWAGAESGVFKFDGIKWLPFDLPYGEEIKGEFITKATSWCVTEDRSGNIWFSTNGFGAFKYDGRSFTQYTHKDGLTDNSVDDIMEDNSGNIWFGTRFGGVSRYDGVKFTNYTQNDIIGNNEVCVIYEDSKGNVWFSSEGYGVYKYNGQSFENFGEKQGLGVRAVQAIYEDNLGQIWAGGGGGLYRLVGKSFVNVTKEGPW